MFHFTGIFGPLLNQLFAACALYMGGATNKKGKQQATAGADKATGLSDTLGTRATGLASTLEPALESQLTNPTGFGASDLSAMNTAAGEAAAGASAGRAGAMRRAAARTRNAGGYAAAEDEAAREGGRQATTAALDIAGKNAQLKASQRENAARELSGLYGTDIGASVNALGLVPNMVNAGTKASEYQSSPFMKFLGELGGLAVDAGQAAGSKGLGGI